MKSRWFIRVKIIWYLTCGIKTRSVWFRGETFNAMRDLHKYSISSTSLHLTPDKSFYVRVVRPSSKIISSQMLYATPTCVQLSNQWVSRAHTRAQNISRDTRVREYMGALQLVTRTIGREIVLRLLKGNGSYYAVGVIENVTSKKSNALENK